MAKKHILQRKTNTKESRTHQTLTVFPPNDFCFPGKLKKCVGSSTSEKRAWGVLAPEAS